MTTDAEILADANDALETANQSLAGALHQIDGLRQDLAIAERAIQLVPIYGVAYARAQARKIAGIDDRAFAKHVKYLKKQTKKAKKVRRAGK